MALYQAKKKEETPSVLIPFVELGFEYNPRKVSSNNCYGDCVLCGAEDKMYISMDGNKGGQWDCKRCGQRGNLYSFMSRWYKAQLDEQDQYRKEFIALANNRQLPPEVLRAAGIVYTGKVFALPVYNTEGSMVNIRRYDLLEKIWRVKKGKKPQWHGLTGIPAHLYGAEKFSRKGSSKLPVDICEGEWDVIALEYLYDNEGIDRIVVGSPGADIWKKEWTSLLDGRDVTCCYDNGNDGARGTERVYTAVAPAVKSFSYIHWPDELPNGFDVRDFVIRDCTYEQLEEMIEPYVSLEENDKKKIEKARAINPFAGADRPSWAEIEEVFGRTLRMNQDMWDGLKVCYAICLTTFLPEEPLWVNLIGPAGSGKTELVHACSGISYSILRSKLTPNELVSGWQGKEEHSLAAKLKDVVLIIKDGTEILVMKKDDKEAVYGTLRGMYDGSLSRSYGNGKNIDYNDIHFNIIFAVTHKIFEERSATYGERFLNFHMIKGIDDKEQTAVLHSALSTLKRPREQEDNDNKFAKGRDERIEISTRFLDFKVTLNDVPDTDEFQDNCVVSLAKLIAILRATVERDKRDRKLLFRPQSEMGTRVAKELYKLLQGLGLCNNPPSIGDEEMRIMTRVALDTCIGFNLDVIAALIETPGQTKQELADDCKMPTNTLGDHLEDLMELGAVYREKAIDGRGRPSYKHYVVDRLAAIWKDAGLTRINGVVRSIERERRKAIKVRVVRRKH